MEFNGFNIEPQSGSAGTDMPISISIATVNEGLDKTVELNAVSGDKIDTLTLFHEGMREELISADGKVLKDINGVILAALKSIKKVNPILTNYLTVTALEDGFTTTFGNACEYCVDGDGQWKSLSANTTTPSINTGQTLSFRARLTPNTSNGIGAFSLKKKAKIQGDAKSMLFADDAPNHTSLSGYDYAFMGLFYNNHNLIEIGDDLLTATALSISCYRRMFQSCTGLVKTMSILPATNLAQYCYRDMFRGCSAMTDSPILPAKTLVAYCYSYMYYYCTALSKITALFTTLSPSTATQNWVTSVASTGTFVKASDATWNQTGASGTPSGWTIIKEG